MSQDRETYIRKAAQRLVLASPLLFVAAHLSSCSDTVQENPPVVPSQTTSQTISGEVEGATSLPATSSREMPIQQKNQNEFITLESGLILYRDVTIDDLLNPNTISKITANIPPQSLSDMKSLLAAAKDAQSTNPDNPEIKKLVRSGANIAKIYCGSEAVDEYMQLYASWGNKYDPETFRTNPESYTGHCDWQNQSEPPQVDNKNKPTSINPENGNLIVTEGEYTFELLPHIDVKTILRDAYVILDPKINSHISPEGHDSIINNLQQAASIETTNPASPQIGTLVTSAAITFSKECRSGQTDGFHTNLMQKLASKVYEIDPNSINSNQGAFLESPCYWGEKNANESQASGRETITIPDGHILYRGIDYADVVESIAKLKENNVYRDSTHATLQRYIQDAINADAKNHGDIQTIFTGINSAANILVGACERSDDAVESLRLLASLVYEKYPGEVNWRLFQIYFDDCLLYSHEQSNGESHLSNKLLS